jgi:HD-GYP domain-containing protein (c-di-GMP phosphodiesterase class II)
MSKKNERNRVLLRNEYGKFVGIETLEDGTTRICLVDSPLKAFDYKSLLFFFKKKKIIANAEHFLNTKLEEKKYIIVEKKDEFVVTKSGMYLKKKAFVLSEETDVQKLTLEQFDALMQLPEAEKDEEGKIIPRQIIHYGVVDELSEAEIFKDKKSAKKALAIINKTHGGDFKIEVI